MLFKGFIRISGSLAYLVQYFGEDYSRLWLTWSMFGCTSRAADISLYLRSWLDSLTEFKFLLYSVKLWKISRIAHETSAYILFNSVGLFTACTLRNSQNKLLCDLFLSSFFPYAAPPHLILGFPHLLQSLLLGELFLVCIIQTSSLVSSTRMVTDVLMSRSSMLCWRTSVTRTKW